MSQTSGIWSLIGGIASFAAAGAAVAFSFGAASAVVPYLISAGAGLVLSGIGSIIAGDAPKKGAVSTAKNSIKAYDVVYGDTWVPGTLVYDQVWGANNAMRDLVIVFAAHPIETVYRLLFDMQFVQMNVPGYPGYAFPPVPLTGGYSTGPTNDGPTNGGYKIQTIVRANDVVTVTMVTSPANTIPFLQAGDQVMVQDTGGGTLLASHGLTGRVQVAQIITASGGYVTTFTYLSGGAPCSITTNGQIKTTWPNYGNNIYAEWSNGGGVPGVSGGTFQGMLVGTPWLGTGQLVTPGSPGPAGFGQGYNSSNPPTNPWNAFCSLQGKAALFLRITGNTTLFPSGLPLISALIRGKSDIYDPRLGAATGIARGGFSSYGSGHVVGDILTIVQGGASGAQITIIAVYDGVLYFKITTPGVGYSLATGLSTTGGTGSGATFDILKLGGSTGTLAYTANSALCIADFCSNTDWGYDMGYGLTPGIPLAQLISAANTCDDSIATVVGGSEPLYSCNGTFELTELPGSIFADLLTSCAGRHTLIGGQLVIWPGIWYGASPTAIDLFETAGGSFTWKPNISIRDLYNGCKGTYRSPYNKYQNTDFPPYAQDTLHGYSGSPQFQGDINLAVDPANRRRWLNLTLKFTQSSRQAQQTAKIEMLRRRHFGTGTFILSLAAYNITALDIISATHSFLGWSGKILEVAADRLKLTPMKTADKKAVMALSVELDVQETDSSIYEWSLEEELTPQGYVQVQWPTAAAAENPTTPWPWSPGAGTGAGVAPLSGDAIFPQGAMGPATFGLTPVITADAQGNAGVTVQISGYAPINNLDTGIALPQISALGATSGGSLPDGTYAVVMTARDAGSPPFKNTQFLQPVLVVISGGGGNGSIAVTIENGAGDDGGDVYIALLGSLTPVLGGQTFYAWHWNQTVAAAATSATIAVFDQSQQGVPDVYFDHLSAILMEVIHGGIFADTIVSVTATTITIGAPAGITANQFAGYTLSLLAKYQMGVPIITLNIPIASHTATTGGEVVYTIGPNSAGDTLPDLTTLLDPDDLLVCRFNATFTANSFTDPNIVNAYYPSGADDVESGYVAIVLTGADAGDIQTVASIGIGFDEFTLTGQWNVTPATGDLVIICKPPFTPEVPGPSLWASMLGQVASMAVPMSNMADQTWLVLVRAEAQAGGHCPDSFAPARDFYCYGAGGTITITAAGALP
jgi:hypothetical protein